MESPGHEILFQSALMPECGKPWAPLARRLPGKPGKPDNYISKISGFNNKFRNFKPGAESVFSQFFEVLGARITFWARGEGEIRKLPESGTAFPAGFQVF